MTSLFHTYVLTVKQQKHVCEPDLFCINLNLGEKNTLVIITVVIRVQHMETTLSSKHRLSGL